MRGALDVISALHEYASRSKIAKGNPQSNACRCHCNHSDGVSGTRDTVSVHDASTSTHDLSSYVWNTEGDGMWVMRTWADDDCSCRCRKERCNPNKSRLSMCDASTSAFDLSAYVWDTGGNMPVTAADVEVEDLASLDDVFAGEHHGESSARSRKRSKVAALCFEGESSSRMKRRRTGSQEEEIFTSWTMEMR